ncbi:MAG: hypothetical protein AB1742_14430 [bacterium]
MKTKAPRLFQLVMFLTSSIAVFSQDVDTFVAKIASFDGRVAAIDAGSSAGLEIGDILVVQADGMKKGLVRVSELARDSARAEVVVIEGGARIRTGDTVAYRLLGRGETAPSPPRAPREIERESPYTWMGERDYEKPSAERTVPEGIRPRLPDVDSLIEEQKDKLARTPGDRRAMYTLADLYFRKGWYQESIAWNQQAVKADPGAPDNDKLLFQIAKAYEKLGMPEKQKLYLDHVRKNYPESPFAAPAEAGIISSPLRTLPSGLKKIGTDATLAPAEKPEIRTPPPTMKIKKGGIKVIPPEEKEIKSGEIGATTGDDDASLGREPPAGAETTERVSDDRIPSLIKEQKELSDSLEDARSEIAGLREELSALEEEKKNVETRAGATLSGRLHYHFLVLNDRYFLLPLSYSLDRRQLSFVSYDSTLNLRAPVSGNVDFESRLGFSDRTGFKVWEAWGAVRLPRGYRVLAGKVPVPFGRGERLLYVPYPSIEYGADFYSMQGVGLMVERVDLRTELAVAVTGGQDYSFMQDPATFGVINIFPFWGPHEGVDVNGRLGFTAGSPRREGALELGLSFASRVVNSQNQPKTHASGGSLDFEFNTGAARWTGEFTGWRLKTGDAVFSKPKLSAADVTFPVNGWECFAGAKFLKDSTGLKFNQYDVGISRAYHEKTRFRFDWKGLKLNNIRRDDNFEFGITLDF